MSIYYKYAPDGTKHFFISYVDDCVYWYNYEALGECFVDYLGRILYLNFLGYAHWFISIRISQMKYHSIYVDQDIYATYIDAKCLYTATVKAGINFYKTTLPSDMIFTKYDSSTSDKQIEKLTGEFNIHYRSFIGSLIYLLSTRVGFSFALHKLAKFSSNPGKLHFEGLVHLLVYIRYNKTFVLKYYAYMNNAPLYDLLR